MSTLARYAVLTAFVLGAVLASDSPAQAQRLASQRLQLINPNPQIAPGVSLLQYSYNTAVLGRAYGQIPPYLMGYNPYMTGYGGGFSPYAAPYYGPAYPTMPYGGGYSPYGGGYGGGGYGAGGVDPFLAGGYGAGGSPYYNPYGGGYGYSSAADLLAYGSVGIDEEKARIYREIANQAKLDTRKKIIDTLAYVRANEYTFTKEQADIAKRLLERIQKTPAQSEVVSGKSLNILLEDLVKFKQEQLSGPTIVLDEDVLKLVNIVGAGSSGNVGLLRNNGSFTWPATFDKEEIISPKDRKDLELEAKQLYDQSANGTPNANILQTVESRLDTMRKNLTKLVGEIPSKNYLDGLRFLDDFNAAVVAMKRGDVVLNLDFQQKFVKDGKRSIPELVDWMGGKGLRFSPATLGDERAYVALQAALSAQSLAIHSLVAASGKAD